MSNTVETILDFFRNNSYKFEYVPHNQEENWTLYFTISARNDHPKIKWIDIRIKEDSENKYTYKLEINTRNGEELEQGQNRTLEQILKIIEDYILAADTMSPDRE